MNKWLLNGVRLIAAFSMLPFALIANAETAYQLGGEAVDMKTIYKEDQASFYDIEKKKYELIERIAREKYLDFFWEKRAKEAGKSVADTQGEYEKKNLTVSDKEVKESLDRFKDHPSLKKLKKDERKKQIEDYLKERGRRELYDQIVEAGIKKGELVISYPKPDEPIYNVKIRGDDVVRYGPEDGDIKPMGCDGNKCPITIVEYSEFQCPFCTRVLPDVKKVLTTYKGKVRWITRDFPLSFHDRARPAAVAARCAEKQGKFWHMYRKLFENQKSLGDSDFQKYAKDIGLNTGDFDKCVKNPKDMEAIIEKNFQSGVKLGVTGTPAFFINGRRLSGALPYDEFRKVIEEELKKDKKS